MAFADDKACALDKIKAFDCALADIIDGFLTGYNKVFDAFVSLHEYFDCYPNFIYDFMDCWDGPSILGEGIYYNEASGTLTDAKLIVRGTASEVEIDTNNGLFPEFVVAGDAVVDNILVKGNGYVGVLSVQAGAQVKVISTDTVTDVNSYIDVLRIVGCNGIGSTVNAAEAGSKIMNLDVSELSYFGGYNCLDPTDVCADDVSALIFSNVGENSLTLKWTDAASSIRTAVYFRTSNAPIWLKPNDTQASSVTGNYIDNGPGYVFRGLEPSTYYDFKVYNVCPNGVFSAGVVATKSTGGSVSCGGGGGSIIIDGQIEFFATDGQTTYVDAALINATAVAVYIEGARKYIGTDPDQVQFDDTTGTVTFNDPLIGPPTSTPGQRVQIDVFR